MLCTCTGAFANVNVPSYPVVFCEALALVHPVGVWAPLYFAVFVFTPV